MEGRFFIYDMKNRGRNFSHLVHTKLQVWCVFFQKKLSKHARLLGSTEYLSVFEVLAIVIFQPRLFHNSDKQTICQCQLWCEIFGFCLLSFCQIEKTQLCSVCRLFEESVFIIQILKNKHTFIRKYKKLRKLSSKGEGTQLFQIY